jgi:hypothetical protein
MPLKSGEKTGQFGLWLTEYINEERSEKDYLVYYDHGDQARYDNVKVIKGFIGEKVKNANRLTDIDVLVANQENEILLLIEIEESPISPKTLLGDIFSSLVSTNFSVRKDEQVNFSVTSGSHLIIASFHPNPERRKNYRDDIRRRIGEFSVPEDSISVDNIEFIIEADLDISLEKLRQRMKKIL